VISDNGTEDAIPQEGEQQTLTADERLKELESQLTEANSKIANQEKSYKGLQTTLNQKSDELKNLQDVTSRLDAMDANQKVLAQMLAETGSVSDIDDVDTVDKKRYLQQFDENLERQRQAQQLARFEEQKNSYLNDANAIYERAKEHLSGKELKDIEILLVDGANSLNRLKLERAEFDVVEAEKTAENNPVETENQIKERVKLEVLKENNLLQTESGRASGMTKSDAQIRDDYIREPDNPEYFRANQERRARQR
jgi:6-pyruvoyl-tetrahydropterin synthase